MVSEGEIKKEHISVQIHCFFHLFCQNCVYYPKDVTFEASVSAIFLIVKPSDTLNQCVS